MIRAGLNVRTPTRRSQNLDSESGEVLVHLVPLWMWFWLDKNLGILGYRLLAVRQGVDLGSTYDGIYYISAFKHSKIKRVKRRMTGRALLFLTW